MAYARFSDEKQFVIVINNRSERAEVVVPGARAGVPEKSRMRRLMYTYDDDYTTEYEEIIVKNGEVVVNMGKHSALVMKTMEF